MLRRSAVFAAALFLAAPVLAQDTQPTRPEPAKEAKPAKKAAAPTLKVGDRAPALTVEKFIKGEPVTGFEKGRVYVVEFWATWCGPCIAAMPHLSAIQKEYKNKGVTVIGVDVWEKFGEDEASKAAMATKVETFVKDQGDRMAYTVAYDGPAEVTDEAFMKAAGRGGIPSSFIVDQKGTIAWIGHPGQIDTPLAEIVAGTWDPKAYAAFADAAKLLATDEKAGLEAWKKAEKDFPSASKSMRSSYWRVLLKAKQYDDAYAAAGEATDRAISRKDAQALNEIAWTIVDPDGDVEKKDLDLALKAAEKADEFSGHKDPAIMDTLALTLFLKGDVNKALEIQQKAVDLADDQMKAELEGRLAKFKKAAGKG
jgi:thiol-disulfide isomerase/thioredoxin